LLAINPKNKEALVGLAVIAYAKDNRAEADGYISTATKNGVMDRRAYQQLGYSLLVANKNKESAMYYEKALAIAPTGVDYYNLACAYAKDGVTEKAMPALELAVKYGFNSKQQYVSDPDLASLQANDRFKKLVETLK
jgi:tetratricopeptide (TPR) repeat protein